MKLIPGKSSFNSYSVIFFFFIIVLCIQGSWGQGTPLRLNVTWQQIYGPPDTSKITEWLIRLKEWRKNEKAQMAYRDANYTGKKISWIQNNFIQTQMMVQERSFYDPIKNEYTVDKYLDEIASRYGGLHSVLVWPTYPNIGIDTRNQFDWIRCMPGGLDGVKKMVAQFHARGVRVLFPYNPWDIGTHREDQNDAETYAKILAYIDADGINGDTAPALGAFWRATFDDEKKGMVIEPEIEGDDKAIEYDQMGWTYSEYPFIPPISRQKWFETRHMVHVCNRWAHDHTDDLQYAFFNGTGFVTWENIWSIYNEMTPRAAETVKRMSAIETTFCSLYTSPSWEPHYPMLQFGVFASKWTGDEYTLWNIVNKNEFDVSGIQMRIPDTSDALYYNLWTGEELQPVKSGKGKALAFDLEQKGYACILMAQRAALSSSIKEFIAKMHEMNKIKISDLSNVWKPIPQTLVKIDSAVQHGEIAPGMVKVPAGKFEMEVSGIEVEGSENPGVDVQMPGESLPRRHHKVLFNMPSFYMDKYPVTNKEFKAFMDATKYHPTDPINFLKDWADNTYPQGWDNKPVTWIDIDDARAYARWAGKRLPHEWEWQYAAQGTDNRAYPWGNAWNAKAVPVPDQDNELRGPDEVTAHPEGISPFGIADLVGNVWQWTDEYVDTHTRCAVIRGGSYYQAQGSEWYFPQAYKLNEHGKLLLMSQGQNRAGTLGFRCVRDCE